MAFFTLLAAAGTILMVIIYKRTRLATYKIVLLLNVFIVSLFFLSTFLDFSIDTYNQITVGSIIFLMISFIGLLIYDKTSILSVITILISCLGIVILSYYFIIAFHDSELQDISEKIQCILNCKEKERVETLDLKYLESMEKVYSVNAPIDPPSDLPIIFKKYQSICKCY